MPIANVVLTTSTRKLMLTGLKLKLPCAFLLKCTSTGCSPAVGTWKHQCYGPRYNQHMYHRQSSRRLISYDHHPIHVQDKLNALQWLWKVMSCMQASTVECAAVEGTQAQPTSVILVLDCSHLLVHNPHTPARSSKSCFGFVWPAQLAERTQLLPCPA